MIFGVINLFFEKNLQITVFMYATNVFNRDKPIVKFSHGYISENYTENTW